VTPSQKTTVYINPAFDKIRRPQILEASKSANLNFTLDTIEGQPITATAAAKVYFIPPKATLLGYREKIYLMAKTLGFDTETVKYKLQGEEAVFDDSQSQLKINITNFNFSFEQVFIKDSSIFATTNIPSKTEIENKAIDFLKNIGRYPDELTQGKTNLIYFSYNPEVQTMQPTQKIDEANVVEIDFYRPDIDDFPIISPRYFNSQNYVVMVFNEDGFKILRAQIKFFEKSEDQMGIYPVKTGEAAYEALKSGHSMIISNPQKKQEITIKKMFLGYFDPDYYQEYLQPVYVFLGTDDFVAYVPAVTDNYLTE